MNTVFLIEDSEECQHIVKKALSKSDIQIIASSTVKEAQIVIRESAPDSFQLILLDLMLPDGDGIQLLNQFQTHENFHNVPVFLFSSKEELTSKVTAFSLGAEDYLVKPVNPIELKARIEMRLKKSAQKKKNLELYQRGDLTLDLSLMKASVRNGKNEKTLDLTHKEFKILSFLLQNEGKVYTRPELVKNIWGEAVHVLDRTVDSHVCGLRKKLGKLSDSIESVPGAGYRFTPFSSSRIN